MKHSLGVEQTEREDDFSTCAQEDQHIRAERLTTCVFFHHYFACTAFYKGNCVVELLFMIKAGLARKPGKTKEPTV